VTSVGATPTPLAGDCDSSERRLRCAEDPPAAVRAVCGDSNSSATARSKRASTAVAPLPPAAGCAASAASQIQTDSIVFSDADEVPGGRMVEERRHRRRMVLRHVPHVAAYHSRRKHVTERRILPPRHNDRQILFAGREQPGMPRVNLIALLQLTAAKNLVHKLMREIVLSGAVGRDPLFKHRLLDPPHRFHLRDARVGHAIHVASE